MTVGWAIMGIKFIPNLIKICLIQNYLERKGKQMDMMMT
jgi:hypothetical protein